MKTTTVLVSRPTQTLVGPCGLMLHLSALEIYPDDPGMGTPMLFEYRGETMTWACGYEGGNLVEIIPPALADTANAWTASIAEQVGAWESYHWDAARKAASL